MPEINRTSSGALLLPRPERRRFALHPERLEGDGDAAEQSAPEQVSAHQLGGHAGATAPRPAPLRTIPPTPPGEPSRLERLGLMTAGVAHDFNNVLSVIMVCAGEIADAAEDRDQVARAEEIRAAAERGAELSRRLLTQERMPTPEAEPIAIEAAIVDALPIVKRTLGDGIAVSLSSQGHVPCVQLAPGELQRMLINLAANSRDAMPGGGAVAIRTAQVTIPAGDPFLGTGWCVRISFTDTGTGMSPDVARHAVQPYFSTKSGGAGSGLGLATVQSLVRARGGDLRLSSPPGHGATISIYLPAVTVEGEALSLPRAATPLHV